MLQFPTALGKTLDMGNRKKGKIYVSMWLDDEVGKKLEAQAAELQVPRSFIIENLLRAEYGLSVLDAPSHYTPVKYANE